MLIRLAKKETDLYPEDKNKQETIFKRYAVFVLPLEEAEWVGLKPWEAMVKQKKIENERMLAEIRPLKEIFAQEIVEKLNKGEYIEQKIEEVKYDLKRSFFFEDCLKYESKNY